MSAAEYLQLAFAALLVVGFCVWDLRSMKELRRRSTHQARLRLYRLILVAEWGSLFIAVCLVRLGQPGSVRTLFASELPFDLRTLPIPAETVWAVAGAFCMGLAVPVVLAWCSAELAAKARLALKPLSFLLPQGSQERWLYAAVALTAGICEEVLYRGFLLHALSHVPALHGRWLLIAALAVLSFGIAHLYQGWLGTLGSAVMAALFIAIFWLTGSLLPGILLHALVDLRPLLLLPAHGSPWGPQDRHDAELSPPHSVVEAE